jgi:hypothetical protein
MQTLQHFLMKFLSLLMLGIGIALQAFWVSDAIGTADFLSSPHWTCAAPYIGLGLILLALLALLPLGGKRSRTLSIPGSYGDVLLDLDPIESTLKHTIAKMPEVKKVRVRLMPSQDRRRVQILAKLWIYKKPETNRQEITGRIEKVLHDSAVAVLGAEEITTLTLEVKAIIPIEPKKSSQPTAPKVAVEQTVQPVVREEAVTAAKNNQWPAIDNAAADLIAPATTFTAAQEAKETFESTEPVYPPPTDLPPFETEFPHERGEARDIVEPLEPDMGLPPLEAEETPTSGEKEHQKTPCEPSGTMDWAKDDSEQQEKNKDDLK